MEQLIIKGCGIGYYFRQKKRSLIKRYDRFFCTIESYDFSKNNQRCADKCGADSFIVYSI